MQHSPITPLCITADARKVSALDFYEMIRPGAAERSAARHQEDKLTCLALLRRDGRAYGFNPMLVAQCEAQLLVERDLGSALVL